MQRFQLHPIGFSYVISILKCSFVLLYYGARMSARCGGMDILREAKSISFLSLDLLNFKQILMNDVVKQSSSLKLSPPLSLLELIQYIL